MIYLIASVFRRWIEDLESKDPKVQAQAQTDWSQALQEPGDFIMLVVAAEGLGLSPSALAALIERRIQKKEVAIAC